MGRARVLVAKRSVLDACLLCSFHGGDDKSEEPATWSRALFDAKHVRTDEVQTEKQKTSK
jgi:hypothetical protein